MDDKIKEIVNNRFYGSKYNIDFFENGFCIFTPDRGSRTDHGGGEDGDGWMSNEQIRRCAAPFHAKWDPKIKELLNEIRKAGYEAEGAMDYGEKGHISLDFYNVKKLTISGSVKKIFEILGNITIKEMSYGLPGETITPEKMIMGKKINNRNCGGDPTPGRKKDLYVTFIVDGKEVRRTLTEGQILEYKP